MDGTPSMDLGFGAFNWCLASVLVPSTSQEYEDGGIRIVLYVCLENK